MSQACFLTATLQGKPAKRAELIELLSSFVPKSQAEPGCVEYQLHVSLADPDVFLFYEQWATREDFERHVALPYQRAWVRRQPELLAEPATLDFYSLVSE